MKKVAITGERKAELVDIPDLRASGNNVVVKIHAAPMCTEYKAFLAGQPQGVIGHEAAGEVVDAGTSQRVKVGDRVVAMPLNGCGECALCRAGDYIHCEQAFALSGFVNPLPGCDTMAQYLLKPDWLLMPIPDDVTYERAALACCGLGPSFGALHAMGPKTGDTILITGAGPVGLGAVVNAAFRGLRIFVMESIPWRVAKAKELGAHEVFNPGDADVLETVRKAAGEEGIACALDCSGNVHAERFCVDAVRRKGKVAFAGECNDDLAIRISPDMIRKGISLHGVWHYNLSDFPGVMEVIRNSPVIGKLISNVLPMSDIQHAFEISSGQNAAKIILKPWE